jgi:glutathione synthase/RimK-type ligase-like ATP-grasp enzyme
MKKIGILYGDEQNFPQELIKNINSKEKNIIAEEISLDIYTYEDVLDYNVIFDRISNKVDFYRSILKSAVTSGVKVVNEPFYQSVDDNFFNASLAKKLKINTPKTIVIPSKEHPEETNQNSFKNLKYPLDWEKAFEYIGFPPILNPTTGESNYNEYKVYNEHEFFSAYALSGRHTMILQEYLDYDEYYRCYTIGMENVKIMSYKPDHPMHHRYEDVEPQLGPKIQKEIENICIRICKAIGFEFNVIEIAIIDGKPYAVEFLNSTPNADKEYLYENNFEWLVNNTADYLISLAKKRKAVPSGHTWSSELKPKPKTKRTLKK